MASYDEASSIWQAPLAGLRQHTQHVRVLNLSNNGLLKMSGLEHLPLLVGPAG